MAWHYDCAEFANLILNTAFWFFAILSARSGAAVGVDRRYLSRGGTVYWFAITNVIFIGLVAELGYLGFALDLYGGGRQGGSPEANAELMQPLLGDRALLQRRMTAGIAALRELPEADPGRVAAIGGAEPDAAGGQRQGAAAGH